jgi:signal transduction histidine kinase
VRPRNTRLHEEITGRLRRTFPDHFAFVLTNPRGEPYWADFDGYVGDVCVQDIQKFAAAGSNQVRIHPNPVEYHYDVMARWHSAEKQERILMVSFKPDQLVQKLRAVKVPGHNFMLVLADGATLIEVTDQGARTVLKREDFRLTAAEQARIVHRRDIPDSRWQLVDLFEAGFIEGHRRELLADMAVFLLVLLGVAAASVALIRREELGRRRAEAAREELIATVTHELRTPLTSLVGSLGLLSSGTLGVLPVKAQELMNIMNRSAEGLRRLIDDLLDARRIESGNLRLELRPVELGALVDEAMLRNAAYARGLNVRFERSDRSAPVWVSADPIRLQQVMTNLLSNAA